MKINEPFGPSTEQVVADEARRMETEVLAQLKSEFQEFVAQTRERLRMVSQSLVELDREYSTVPPVVVDQHAVAQEVIAQEVIAQEVIAQEVVSQQKVEAPTAHEVSPEPAQADRSEWLVGPTPATADKSEAPVSELNFWSEALADPDPQPIPPRPTMAEDASNDASFPRTSNLDSDPTERLKAIKQRLARQIENS